MAKPSKPLRILLHPLLDSSSRTLVEKGHEVTIGLIEDYDLVMGPNCWRMTPELSKHVDLAIKGARALKFGHTKGRVDDSEKSGGKFEGF